LKIFFIVLVAKTRTIKPYNYFSFFFLLLFICAYKAWFISPPCPHPSLTTHSAPSLSPPSIPSRNYFALISNFVEETV
jgi:hypothetical protein